MKVSIIIPCYKESHVLDKTIRMAISQKYTDKEIIIVADNATSDVNNILKKYSKKLIIIKNNSSLGLSGSLNKGIKKSKGSIVVTLLADCIPRDKNWLEDLIKPFSNRYTVATGSSVNNPTHIFDAQDDIVKELSKHERGIYTPELDEKGCAYRKSTLIKVGLFDEKHFKTAGEDFDMTLKMKKEGQVLLGVSVVDHIHPLTLDDFYNRFASYARGFGVLFRIYGTNIKSWKSAIARSLFPIWAIAKTIKLDNKKIDRYYFFMVNLKLNWIYFINFLKSFLRKSQW